MGALTNWGAAEPSFLGGLASVMDMGNTLTEYSSIDADLYDTFQLALDWRVVGEDMRRVLRRHSLELEKAGRLPAGAR